MKHRITLVTAFLLLSSAVYSQMYFNFGKNYYYKGTVYLSDGSKMDGYIEQFDPLNFVNSKIADLVESFQGPEKELGFSNPFYNFRKTKKGKEIHIPFEDIKKIKRYEYNPKTEKFDKVQLYEKIRLVRVNNTLEVEELTDFMIPIYYKNDKISVYGFNLIYRGSYNYEAIVPLFYFKTADGDFAIKPIEFNGATVMNREKTYKNYLRTFAYLGKDCPKFKNKIKDIVPFTLKEFKKRIRDDLRFKDLEKAYKKKRKAAKRRYKRGKYEKVREILYRQYLQNIAVFWYNTYYKDFVDAYTGMCDD